MGRGIKIAIAAVGVLAVVGAGGFIALSHHNDAKVKEIASPRMGCAADQIEIVERFAGDTTETYELKGCGKSGTLLCSAPDFECNFAPTN